MYKAKTNWKKRPHQKDTRKINATCISRMYVDYYEEGHVTAVHVTGHTNHQPGPHEDMYLPLPKSIREEIAIKLSNGIPAERIMEGITWYCLSLIIKLLVNKQISDNLFP